MTFSLLISSAVSFSFISPSYSLTVRILNIKLSSTPKLKQRSKGNRCPDYTGANPQKVHMLSDNQGALALVENPHLNERSKHTYICYHHTRSLAERVILDVECIPTTDMVADGMTKPLLRINFEKFTS